MPFTHSPPARLGGQSQTCAPHLLRPQTQSAHSPEPAHTREVPLALAPPSKRGQVLSIDFMHDNLNDGRAVRTFNVIDDCNREGLLNEAGFSFPAARVTQLLDQKFEWSGVPAIVPAFFIVTTVTHACLQTTKNPLNSMF